MNTRREILKLATLAGAGRFGAMNAFAQGADYKASQHHATPTWR